MNRSRSRARSSCARAAAPSAAQSDWPVYAERRRRPALLAARPDHRDERREARGRLADPHRRPRRRPAAARPHGLPGDADPGRTACSCCRRRSAACSRSTRRRAPSAGASTPTVEGPRVLRVHLARRRVVARRRSAAPDAPCRARIFAATVESRLFALDAATGKLCAGFGRGGEVSLREGIGEPTGPGATRSRRRRPSRATSSSSARRSATTGASTMPKGIVRAYDARTGALRLGLGSDPAQRRRPDLSPSGRARARRAPAPRTRGRSSRTTPRAISSSCRPRAPEPRLLRRRAPRQQPLRELGGGAAREARGARRLAVPDRAPRPLGLRRARAAGARRRSCATARELPVVVQATKMGFLFVLRPRDRRAGLPGRGAAGAGVRRARRGRRRRRSPSRRCRRRSCRRRCAPRTRSACSPWDRGAAARSSRRCATRASSRRRACAGRSIVPGQRRRRELGQRRDRSRSAASRSSTRRTCRSSVRLIPRADYEREKAAGGGLIGLREFAPMLGTPYGMVREPLLGPLRLPCTPPPWGMMGAVSLDTGEILWQVPLGTVPDRIPCPLSSRACRTWRACS